MLNGLERVAIESVIRGLPAVEPKVTGTKLAGVAVIVRAREDLDVLLIQRAVKEGDPWSGQVAFPGGKRTEEDRTMWDTAIRETKEELGFDLGEAASFAGYAGLFKTHSGNMVVVPSVFVLTRRVRIKPNQEVSSFRWVGLLRLEKSETTRVFELNGRNEERPAFVVGDYIVWGLTYRIIDSLLVRAGIKSA